MKGLSTSNNHRKAALKKVSPDSGDELANGAEEGSLKKPAAVYADKKPAVVSKELSPSKLLLLSPDKKPAAVWNELSPSNLPLPSQKALFGDIEEEDNADPELLALPSVRTGINVNTTYVSPTVAQTPGAGIADIDSRFLDAKFDIEPRNTSKSMCDMSISEKS